MSGVDTARSTLRAHVKVRSNVKVGLRNPAQVMANTTVPGGAYPILWLADDGPAITLDGPVNVDEWESRNQIGKPEESSLPILYQPVSLTSASDAARPRRALTASTDMRSVPSYYLSDAPSVASLSSVGVVLGYAISDNGNVSYPGTMFGFAIAKPLDLTGNSQVVAFGNPGTGELVTLHRHASQTAWALTSAGSGHAHSIGSAAATPLDSTKFQIVRFRLNSSHVHSLQVGQRAPVSSSAGSNGYDWGEAIEDTTIIELFTNNSSRTVQIAAAFICFGGNPTADQEAEIDAWLAFHFPNALTN
jgi:hypothetical protein